MKPIKIYLQYPWKFPDSPYYKYLLQDSPEGIEYLNAKKQKGVITNKTFFLFSNFLKRKIRRGVRIFYSSMLNTHKSPRGDYNLIHCAHCLSKNKDKPWVADFEAFWQLWVSTKKTKRGIKKVEKILRRENCKKILPWTKKVYDELIKEFPKYKNKFEIVFPAVPLNAPYKKPSDKIKLIFVGRYFYWKGGFHSLIVMDKLTKKYKNVEAVLISDVPEEIKKKYSKNKKLKIYDLIPHKMVSDFYKKSDIFVYPGYSDSFGFAFLEAMSFGIPTITVDGDSRKELIENGKTGFIIDKDSNFEIIKEAQNQKSTLIDKLVKETSKLIEDKALLEKMSKNCIKIIKDGKFSIKERNKKLKRIYEEAVK